MDIEEELKIIQNDLCAALKMCEDAKTTACMDEIAIIRDSSIYRVSIRNKKGAYRHHTLLKGILDDNDVLL